MNKPLRGQVWLVDLDPTQGREQAKTRPCLIVSHNNFNRSAAELVIVLPLTSKNKHIPFHTLLKAKNTGLSVDSFVMPEQIRSISITRCLKYLTYIEDDLFKSIDHTLKVILDLE